MRLSELEAYFVGEFKIGPPSTMRKIDNVEGAQGLMFLCPKCFRANGNSSIGTHWILCWFKNSRGVENVPDHVDPKPGRWNFEGENIEEISFVGPGAASVLLTSGCNWHGFIRNGSAVE